MKYLRSFNRFIPISLALMGLSISSAMAASYNVVGGELQGIDGLTVDGTLYNVTFVDGTCATVYFGCNDHPEDFTIPSIPGAKSASQAIVDAFTTLGGIYDTMPNLIRGIEDTSMAEIWTASQTVTTGNALLHGAIIRAGGVNGLLDCGGQPSCNSNGQPDLTTDPVRTWARWTAVSAVPVPAAVWLFGTALVGLVGFTKRKKAA